MKQEIDHELIQRCMEGDWTEADILLGAVEKWSYYLCRKMLPNEEDARDATQEILLTIYQKLGTLKAPEAFWGWVQGAPPYLRAEPLQRLAVEQQRLPQSKRRRQPLATGWL